MAAIFLTIILLLLESLAYFTNYPYSELDVSFFLILAVFGAVQYLILATKLR